MLTYNELVAKRTELEKKKTITHDLCVGKETQRVNYESELQRLSSEQDNNIKTAYSLALKDQISKSTLKYENMISKLNNNREQLLTNKQKRLDNINYESYSDSVKSDVSIEDCMEKCNSIKETLMEKQGTRLFNVLTTFSDLQSPDLYSLEDIHEAFDDLDVKLRKLSNTNNFLNTVYTSVSDIKINSEDKVQVVSSLVMCAILFVLFLYFTPFFVLLLVFLLSYNLYKSYYMYNCLVFVGNIMNNLSFINDSIERGITAKMEEDKLHIDNKFKSKLMKIDENLDALDEKIIEITEAVTNSFTFNSDRIKDSFLIKEQSLKERISLLKSEYVDLNADISDLDKEISDVNMQIIKLSKSIFEQYYPTIPKEKFQLYPNDMLFDIVDNKPNIFTLPTGSACFIFKSEDVMFDFITTYLTLLYSNLLCSSFNVHFYDSKYVGTKSIEFTKLKNFCVYSEKNGVKEDVTELRVEMGKRISLLGGDLIKDYNESMIKEESVPLSYHVVLDLFTDPNDFTEEYKQVLINGFNSGIIPMSFMLESDIEFSDSSRFKDVLPLYKDFYLVTSDVISKKSKIFFENKMKK